MKFAVALIACSAVFTDAIEVSSRDPGHQAFPDVYPHYFVDPNYQEPNTERDYSGEPLPTGDFNRQVYNFSEQK